MKNAAASRIGYIASIMLICEVLIFAISLIPGFWGINLLMLSFFASFLIAPSFMAMMISLHTLTTDNNKVWSHLGVAFSIVYAVLILIAYYTQLVIVRSNSMQLSPEIMKLLVYKPGSLIFALDMLGYGFMCLATLVAVPVFVGGKEEKRAKMLFIINGVFFIPSLIFPALNFSQNQASTHATDLFGTIANLFWCLLFLALSASMVAYFRKCRKTL
ncbi:MAG: hypothetical protein ACYCX4_02165 [Bacillota bacterium]